MSLHNKSSGFTLLELIVTIALIGIFSTIFLIVFKSTLFSYLDLQKQASSFGQMSNEASRIATVLRGATSVRAAADNDLTVYAYFYPSDNYVSQVRYYVAATNGQKQLIAELTPMTANPPVGTLDTAKSKRFIVIDNFYQPTGAKLFSYLNASNAVLTTPVTDMNTVKLIQIRLSSSVGDASSQDMVLQVMLRNRKNNL